jgi:hypothetical protein
VTTASLKLFLEDLAWPSSFNPFRLQKDVTTGAYLECVSCAFGAEVIDLLTGLLALWLQECSRAQTEVAMSTYLTTLVHEGVDMFCKAVKKERQLSPQAIERVQHAAFNRDGDEAERIAAEEALCEVLIDRLRVDKWWEQVTDDSKAIAFARAIAVAHELVRSAEQDMPYYREAERDGNQALQMLRRGMPGDFQEEVDRECMDVSLSDPIPRIAR